jgi:hypothetical protein
MQVQSLLSSRRLTMKYPTGTCPAGGREFAMNRKAAVRESSVARAG